MKVKDKEKLNNPLEGWQILSAISSMFFTQCSAWPVAKNFHGPPLESSFCGYTSEKSEYSCRLFLTKPACRQGRPILNSSYVSGICPSYHTNIFSVAWALYLKKQFYLIIFSFITLFVSCN